MLTKRNVTLKEIYVMKKHENSIITFLTHFSHDKFNSYSQHQQHEQRGSGLFLSRPKQLSGSISTLHVLQITLLDH